MSDRHKVRRAWRRALRVGPVLMLAVFLSSALYVDHWIEFLHHHHEQEESATEEATHSLHCHQGPASCSDQPVPPNQQSFASVVDLPVVSLATVLMEERQWLPEEFILLLPTEPPQGQV